MSSDDNKGLASANQKVVDEALGDFIVWVDGGLVLKKTYVRKQIEFLGLKPRSEPKLAHS